MAATAASWLPKVSLLTVIFVAESYSPRKLLKKIIARASGATYLMTP